MILDLYGLKISLWKLQTYIIGQIFNKMVFHGFFMEVDDLHN